MIDECSILWRKRRKRNSIVKILSLNTAAKACTFACEKIYVAYSASVE